MDQGRILIIFQARYGKSSRQVPLAQTWERDARCTVVLMQLVLLFRHFSYTRGELTPTWGKTNFLFPPSLGGVLPFAPGRIWLVGFLMANPVLVGASSAAPPLTSWRLLPSKDARS